MGYTTAPKPINATIWNIQRNPVKWRVWYIFGGPKLFIGDKIGNEKLANYKMFVPNLPSLSSTSQEGDNERFKSCVVMSGRAANVVMNNVPNVSCWWFSRFV